MLNFIKFLKGKLVNISIWNILYLEIESWSFWIFNLVPGGLGFILRNWIACLFFKNKKGFSWIQPNVIFVHANKFSAGENFGVNSGTYINAVGGITMGDYVLIGSNVTISSGLHPIDDRMPPVYARPTVPMPIVIENDVWIGAGAVIMPGVTLAQGTVVGANSVVTKSTEPYSVVAGVPAKKLRQR